MSMCSFLFIFLSLLSVSQSALPSATTAATPDQTHECTPDSPTHWIFALDKSGSMAGAQWNNLKNLMSDVAAITSGKMSVYTFDSGATVPPSQYYLYNDPGSWNSAVLPGSPGGGTNFGEAILRAIEIILDYRNSHTCFVMITDGQAPYPTFQIAIYNSVRDWLRERKCRTCALCYFIKENSNSVVPDSYQRLCKSIGAQTPIPRGSANVRNTKTSQFILSPVAVVEGKTLDSQILSSFKAKQLVGEEQVAVRAGQEFSVATANIDLGRQAFIDAPSPTPGLVYQFDLNSANSFRQSLTP